MLSYIVILIPPFLYSSSCLVVVIISEADTGNIALDIVCFSVLRQLSLTSAEWEGDVDPFPHSWDRRYA